MTTETKPKRTLLDVAREKQEKAAAKVAALELRQRIRTWPKRINEAYALGLQNGDRQLVHVALDELKADYDSLHALEYPEAPAQPCSLPVSGLEEFPLP